MHRKRQEFEAELEDFRQNFLKELQKGQSTLQQFRNSLETAYLDSINALFRTSTTAQDSISNLSRVSNTMIHTNNYS